LSEVLQAMVDICEEKENASFFGPQLQGLLQLLLQVVRADGLEDRPRQLALELLVVLIQAKTKLCTKAFPELKNRLLRLCAELMIAEQLEDPRWAAQFDDNLEEQSLADSARECLPRLAEAFGAETFLPSTFRIVADFISQQEWSNRVTGLAIVAELAESIEDESHVDDALKLSGAHLTDAHPRVRNAALSVISQVSLEHCPYVQNKHHATLLPKLCHALDDCVPRVQVAAMEALVDFADINELEADFLIPFVPGIMQKMALRMTQPIREIREMAITVVGTTAGTIKEAFCPYYGEVLPVLRQAIVEAGKDHVWLRGKAIECVSMIAVAVGKETFAADADAFVGACVQLLHATREGGELADDEGVLHGYAVESLENFATVLKRDFARYAPVVMPDAIRAVSTRAEVVDHEEKKDKKDWTLVLNEGGRCEGLKTLHVEEMGRALGLLRAVVAALSGDILPYFPEAARALMSSLDFTLDDELRGKAAAVLAELLVAGRRGVEARAGTAEAVAGMSVLKDLLEAFLEKTFSLIEAEDDPAETMTELAHALGRCVEAAGPGLLLPEGVVNLSDTALRLVEASLRRTAETLNEDDEDEDDEDDDDDEEEDNECDFRQGVGVALPAALMKAAPEVFSKEGCLERWDAFCARLLQISVTQDKSKKGKKKKDVAKEEALHAAAAAGRQTALEYLGRRFEMLGDSAGLPGEWDKFLAKVLQCLGDEDEDVQTAAAGCIARASATSAFASSQAVAAAVKALTAVMEPKGKKAQEESVAPRQVAAVALLSFGVERQGSITAVMLHACLDQLPLDVDEVYDDDIKWLTSRLLHWVRAQNTRLIGDNMGNLPKVLGVVAESYEYFDEDMNSAIQALFRDLGLATLEQMYGAWTEAQRKAIGKIVRGAA